MEAETAQLALARKSRWRRWRFTLVCWVLALLAFVAEQALASRPTGGTLLIGSIDQEAFQFLALLATVVLATLALWATVSAVTSLPALGWKRAIRIVLHLAIAGALLSCTYPLLLLGALSFSNEYRTIGSIDGHELIVSSGVGLGQFPIHAGLRHGPFVNFGETTGDYWTTGDVSLPKMTFDITEDANAITVTYAPGPDKATGTMVISKE